MTKFYEIEITETRVTTTRCIVEALDSREALGKALAGDTVASGAPEPRDDLARREASVETRGLVRGTSLERVRTALRKTHAFTVHARLWEEGALAPEREYAVISVGSQDRRDGMTIVDFPEVQPGSAPRFVPAENVFGLRIESESDEISYAVSDIRYDTDGETAIVDLPEELEIDLPSDTDPDDVEELLGDAITERTGWCHKGFDYELAA